MLQLWRASSVLRSIQDHYQRRPLHLSRCSIQLSCHLQRRRLSIPHRGLVILSTSVLFYELVESVLKLHTHIRCPHSALSLVDSSEHLFVSVFLSEIDLQLYTVVGQPITTIHY
jgi:hypothetical protein